ncbi:hypothetical protein PFISCL1PPCAC_4623, partial [Pristionchus fissidentatus]
SLRLDCLRICLSDNVVKCDIMESLFEGVAIYRLEADVVDNFDADRFLQFIKRSQVESLEIGFDDWPISNPEEFLLKIAEICSTVHIKQGKDPSIAEDTQRHLLGKSNFDWTDTFVAMFKRKMNYLKVSNFGYPAYFTEANCEEMKK